MTETRAIPLGRTLTADTYRSIGFAPGKAPGSGSEVIVDETDAGLVTIAGTGSGKGVSQVIPTALTYPGSLVIMDPKGEIAAVTARRRREMGQQVVRIDPFGSGRTDALDPFEAIDPTSIDAADRARRLATQLAGTPRTHDPFWDQSATTIVAASILFIATHVAPEDESLVLLHRMWGVADHLEDILACMTECRLHGGVMASGARLYTEAPDKTAGSILTTLREHISCLASPRAARALAPGGGLLRRIREGQPMTLYLRIPPHLSHSHCALLRLWLGTIITTVAERRHRPEIPDLFLVDEAATIGRLEELLTAASLLRGYGLRTWTFWQSLSQIEGLYGDRANEILDNAGTLSVFGTTNGANAQAARWVTGFEDDILGMSRDEQIVARAGARPVRARRLNYLVDPEYQGLFDPNPFHARPSPRGKRCPGPTTSTEYLV